MSIMSSRNLTMMTDLYQLTMMYGYFKKGMAGNKAVFDLFFRDKSEFFLCSNGGHGIYR